MSYAVNADVETGYAAQKEQLLYNRTPKVICARTLVRLNRWRDFSAFFTEALTGDIVCQLCVKISPLESLSTSEHDPRASTACCRCNVATSSNSLATPHAVAFAVDRARERFAFGTAGASSSHFLAVSSLTGA
jgi:hypothetical protein